MTTPTPFPLTFTAGGLFAHEGQLIAQRLIDGQSWDTIRQAVFHDNLLQVTRVSSIKRLYSEVQPRLQMLNQRQLYLLVHGQDSEQRAILWLAVCRHYPFVAAFARLINQRYRTMQYLFDNGEYAYFYSRLAEQHPRLSTLTLHTQQKMRSVVYKMAREVHILNQHKQIQGVFLSQAVIDTLSHHDELLFFPT